MREASGHGPGCCQEPKPGAPAENTIAFSFLNEQTPLGFGMAGEARGVSSLAGPLRRRYKMSWLRVQLRFPTFIPSEMKNAKKTTVTAVASLCAPPSVWVPTGLRAAAPFTSLASLSYSSISLSFS